MKNSTIIILATMIPIPLMAIVTAFLDGFSERSITMIFIILMLCTAMSFIIKISAPFLDNAIDYNTKEVKE